MSQKFYIPNLVATEISDGLTNTLKDTLVPSLLEYQVYSIGAGGDFETLNKAFEFIRTRKSKRLINQTTNQITYIVLRLKNGYVENEQLIFINDDLYNVVVVSENNSVHTINATNFRNGFFISGFNSSLPIFAVSWNLTNMPTNQGKLYMHLLNSSIYVRAITLGNVTTPTQININGFDRFMHSVISNVGLDNIRYIFSNSIIYPALFNANYLVTINSTLDFSSCNNMTRNYYVQLMGATQMAISNMDRIVLPQNSSKSPFNVATNSLTTHGILQILS